VFPSVHGENAYLHCWQKNTACWLDAAGGNQSVERGAVTQTCTGRSVTPCGKIRLKWPISFYTLSMRNEFTAVIERDNDWFVAWSPEIPGANGQGRSVEECRESLGAAIQLILEDRREDGLRGAPADALRETVTIR
jgi:predicted RNase H-like HicB family nuclease